jgi:ribosomal protein S12 methylthiotransferase accessory factor YcaO
LEPKTPESNKSDEDNALFPNQFVNARLLVDTNKETSIVPAAAVQRSPQAAIPAEPPTPVITVSDVLAFRKHRCENTP